MSATDDHTRGIRRDLFTAFAVALTVRLAYLLALRRAIDMADAIHYLTMAKQFAAGDFLGFDENLPVLYSLFGATTHLVFVNWEHAMWAVSLLASSLLVVPVYYLSRELHGRSTARTAAALVCLWPWLVDYGSRIAPEALAVTLFFTAIWLFYSAIERGRYNLVVAPLALFLLHLTRPEGTFLMIAAPVGGLLLTIRRDRIHWRRLGIVTAQCAFLLALYALFMRVVIGTATVSYRAPMATDLGDYFSRGALDLGRTAMALLFEVLPVMLGPLLLIFLGLGLFTAPERRRLPRLEALILFFCGIQWTLTLANFSPTPRYVMAVVVALSLWSAHGIVVLSRQWRQSSQGAWAQHVPFAVLAATLLLGLAANIASESISGMPRTPREYRIAGKWMRTELPPGYIISRKPQIGFYADMPSIGPDAAHDAAGVVAFAEQIGARYLVIDERHSAAIVPGLRPLLDPANAPAELRLIRADLSPYEGARVVLYEFVPPGIAYLDPKDAPTTNSRMGPDERRRKTDTTDD